MNGESGEAASPPPPPPVGVLVASQLGTLGVEFRGSALTRIVFNPSGRRKKEFIPFADFEDSDYLDEVFGRLSEYLSGARRSLDLEYDLNAAAADFFERRVLRETARTPYGKTRTYKEIADAVGRPEAYRQVLSILERNPLPLLIPCHRIVPTKSGIGGYVGGAHRKRWLLRMERENAPAASA